MPITKTKEPTMLSPENSVPSFWSSLPLVEGSYTPFAPLAPLTWFKTGGCADVLFEPKSLDDLIFFLQHAPSSLPLTILGKCSNTLIRDGGIEGVVIKLGNAFSNIHIDGTSITVGAGLFDAVIAKTAMTHSIGGMEFLSGIPGCLGGAVVMNAGAYGREIKDILQSVTYLTRHGDVITQHASELTFSYRHTHLPHDIIIIEATLKGTQEDPSIIQKRIHEIRTKRRESQPIKEKTGGSTFRNPSHTEQNAPLNKEDAQQNLENPTFKHAWQVVEACGLRGHAIGDAVFSPKHCNFLVNRGNATSSNLENLGEHARTLAKNKFNIDLIWEIKRIGRHAS